MSPDQTRRAEGPACPGRHPAVPDGTLAVPDGILLSRTANPLSRTANPPSRAATAAILLGVVTRMWGGNPGARRLCPNRLNAHYSQGRVTTRLGAG